MNAKQKSSHHISPDPDLPEITDDWIAGADLYHGSKLVRRGRPKSENPRQLLSLRLPPQVIARWKASGPGWQTRMAEALEKTAPKIRAAG
ncbi:MAG: BrnA antitoxin family protein [Dokdonella sp.]|uniref:BrnA antitoxin family protein n=1 Tax=Dokdonella sp. TaxID=2291710 RepID=UPI0025B8543D|nr:BrnA antitoxin family protein [Dokdonella sp.]MBX3475959.1 BrnA antitoxin family protein [Planctomycetota bacterium]MBX3701964.1 BrnA antitoxin family protein [Dokdonella sp.]